MANARYCTVPGCDKKHRARGFCNTHYENKRLAGVLVVSDHLTRTPEERFWAKVDKSGDCWTWTGGKNFSGYGHFVYGGTTVKAHRFVYELEVGPIPDGLEIRHLCNNGHLGCVTPSHMVPGTRSENRIDLTHAGTNKYQKLSVVQVLAARYAIATTPATYRDMATVFGVKQTTLYDAVTGRSFAHLPGAVSVG